MLLHNGKPVPLGRKTFETLLVLAQNSGQIVTKDDLMSRLWPDTIVEENNLTQRISQVRKILGESSKDHEYIVTCPGQGYCFVAAVKKINEETDVTASDVSVANLESNEKGCEDLEATVEQSTPSAIVSSDLRPRLQWKSAIRLVLLSGLIALPGYIWIKSKDRAKPSVTSSGRPRSLAVLPFKSLSREETDNHLGPGIADALIVKLSNIDELSVRPTRGVLKYDGSMQSPITAGSELEVDSVLDGTIQRVGDRLRVTVQLVRVRDGKPLWARSFDEQFTDIFAIQDSISEHVAEALMLELTDQTQRVLTKHETDRREAYQAYLRGRYFWNRRTKEGLTRAIEYFQQAVAADPKYARAYAGMADSYALMAMYFSGSLPPGEACRKAKQSAQQALGLDESLAEAHTSLAVWFFYNQDPVSAEREFKRALELDPTYASAHQWYGESLRSIRQFDQAFVELKRAQELDPLSPAINSSLGTSFYFERQYDQMIEQNRKALEIEPRYARAHLGIGLALEQKGMYEEAIAEFQKASELSGGSEQIMAALAHTYAITGNRNKAQRLFDELHGQSNRKPVSPFYRALFYAGLGQRKQAFVWLQKAQQEQSEFPMLKADPRLDDLRVDPKFQTLLKAEVSETMILEPTKLKRPGLR